MSEARVWFVIVALGAATYAVRAGFLIATRERGLPEGVRRFLAYVPVTVLPALIVPIIVFPEGGEALEPRRLIAAAAALGIGVATRSVVATIVVGIGVHAALGAL